MGQNPTGVTVHLKIQVIFDRKTAYEVREKKSADRLTTGNSVIRPNSPLRTPKGFSVSSDPILISTKSKGKKSEKFAKWLGTCSALFYGHLLRPHLPAFRFFKNTPRAGKVSRKSQVVDLAQRCMNNFSDHLILDIFKNFSKSKF